VTRRRQERAARARLALLEAQAWNDLGQPDEALERVDAALQLAPEMLEATHERGVALFNLCRFEESMTVFEQVLREAPEDPYAHHHLGLILERLGRAHDAEAHFRRARALAPGEFAQPVLLSAEEFAVELDRAVAELPAEVRGMLEQAVLEVADVPSVADLTAIEPPFSPTILGLYRGLPLGAEPPSDAEPGTIPPRGIVLYRNNLARAVKSRDELISQIRRTLYHEIGHLQGMDEDELRRRGLD
jgi:predicted Zn-dependent protease with MMP-like domain